MGDLTGPVFQYVRTLGRRSPRDDRLKSGLMWRLFPTDSSSSRSLRLYVHRRARVVTRLLAGLTAIAATVAALGAISPSVAAASLPGTELPGTPFAYGDILVSLGRTSSSGAIDWRDSTTRSKGHIEASGSWEQLIPAGSAFDASGNLYVTMFGASGQRIQKYDNEGHDLGRWDDQSAPYPESIVFDRSGNAYVGHASSSGQAGFGIIQKYDSSGHLIDTFYVETEARGADWIDLAPDQCTIYYTSEGARRILRYDVCARR